MLPDRDGRDVTRVVRADTALAATPSIMLPARVEDTDKIAGLELGTGLPVNPVSPEDAVEELLGRTNGSVGGTG